ncbi:MAG: methylenetetrahydrofolate reductase [Deltaproteobacteria bacterium]
MSFRDKLVSGQRVLTVEAVPLKGISFAPALEQFGSFRTRIDAVNVTDLQSSTMRLCALAAAVQLKQAGMEPVLQMTCRDRNRLALQADLLGAASFGIENILALTGDHPLLGDHPGAKPVFDLDAVQLIDAARGLESGHDMAGRPLTGAAPRFCIGAVVNPGAEPLEPELIKMEKKLAAGASFFQTQALFDEAVAERFFKAVAPFKARILAGVVVLRSEKMARHMNDHVPGVRIPEPLIRELAEAADRRAVAIRQACSLIRKLGPMGQGVHLMPIGWYNVVPEILDGIGA